MINLQKPLGHKDDCQCEDCQDYRGFLMGQAALLVMQQRKQQQQSQVPCASCSKQIPSRSNFCPFCGAAVAK